MGDDRGSRRDLRVIVIGAGLAGLVAANRLAAAASAWTAADALLGTP